MPQGFCAVREVCGGAVGGVVGLAAGVEEDVAVVFVEVVVFASLGRALASGSGDIKGILGAGTRHDNRKSSFILSACDAGHHGTMGAISQSTDLERPPLADCKAVVAYDFRVADLGGFYASLNSAARSIYEDSAHDASGSEDGMVGRWLTRKGNGSVVHDRMEAMSGMGVICGVLVDYRNLFDRSPICSFVFLQSSGRN